MKYTKKFTMVWMLLLVLLLGAGPTNAAGITSSSESGIDRQATRDIVQEIINVIGLKPRFELVPADIDNAAAVVHKGKRYILYNERFLAELNNAVHTDWGGISIIAHEIGHHLNGHTLSQKGSNPADELEADEFSGFVLRKMGANLAEAQAAIKLLSEERTSRTHPGRSQRMQAISKGWKSANEQLASSTKMPQSDQRTIAKTRPTQRQLQQIQSEQPLQSKSSSLDGRYVLSRVHFSKAPREEFYITTKLHLVHVTDDGVKIIGKLAKTNDPEFPYYFESNVLQHVFVTDRGILVNRKGQKVGYLT